MHPYKTYMEAPHVPQNVTPRHVIDNISDTAREFTIFKQPYFDEFRQRDVTEVTFELPGRFQLGALEEPGRLTLLHIGAHGYENQGKGYGTAAHEAAIKYAADNELRFFANAHLTPETDRLVAAVGRKGYVMHIIDGGSWMANGAPSVEFWTTPQSFTPLHDAPLDAAYR